MTHRPLYRRKRFWLLLPVALFILVGFIPLVISLDMRSPLVPALEATRQTAHVTYNQSPMTVSHVKAGAPGGQRVVFVHGTPGDAGVWESFLADVPDGFEFISIDRPGFGDSLPVTAEVRLNAQAAALKPFLETPGGRPTILVGHSLGGPIVAAAAALYPNRVGGVMVVAGSLDPALEEIKWIQYAALLPPYRWTLPQAILNTNEEVFALKAELEHLQGKLGLIKAPVEIIHGTADDLVPYANVAFMTAHLTGSAAVNVVTLEGQNHFLPWNSEGEIRRALKRLASASPLTSTKSSLLQPATSDTTGPSTPAVKRDGRHP